jgi:hypothetical protein
MPAASGRAALGFSIAGGRAGPLGLHPPPVGERNRGGEGGNGLGFPRGATGRRGGFVSAKLTVDRRIPICGNGRLSTAGGQHA